MPDNPQAINKTVAIGKRCRPRARTLAQTHSLSLPCPGAWPSQKPAVTSPPLHPTFPNPPFHPPSPSSLPAEVVKRRVGGLHQLTATGSLVLTDDYEPNTQAQGQGLSPIQVRHRAGACVCRRQGQKERESY